MVNSKNSLTNISEFLLKENFIIAQQSYVTEMESRQNSERMA